MGLLRIWTNFLKITKVGKTFWGCTFS